VSVTQAASATATLTDASSYVSGGTITYTAPSRR